MLMQASSPRVSGGNRSFRKEIDEQSISIAREFVDSDTAIKNAQQLAAMLGRGNFAPGTKIIVTNEAGDTIAEIPFRKLAS